MWHSSLREMPVQWLYSCIEGGHSIEAESNMIRPVLSGCRASWLQMFLLLPEYLKETSIKLKLCWCEQSTSKEIIPLLICVLHITWTQHASYVAVSYMCCCCVCVTLQHCMRDLRSMWKVCRLNFHLSLKRKWSN